MSVARIVEPPHRRSLTQWIDAFLRIRGPFESFETYHSRDRLNQPEVLILVTSDNELLCLYVRHGDEEALERLIRRHSAMVLGVCRGYLWRREDAEDAFQATFVLLSMKAPKLLNHKSIGGWLHEATTRTCLQLRRRVARSREVKMVEMPSKENEPWQTIAETRNLESLHREISRLPKRYREVLVLYHFEGKSRSQIASLLGCTTASVKAALARARDLLRHRLLQRGITASTVLGCAAAMTKNVRADTSTVTDTLIRSTLDYCSDRPPSVDVGNGPEFLESLLAKETFMTTFGMSTVHALTGIAAAAVVLCVASVAAIADAPGDSGKGEVVVSVTEHSSNHSPRSTSTVVVQNDSGKSVVVSGPIVSTTSDARIPVDATTTRHVQTTHAGSPQLSLKHFKTDGKIITYSAPVFTYIELPQTYEREVPYVESGVQKYRTETATRKVTTARLNGKTEDRPLPKNTTFETLHGKELSTQEMIDRLGKQEVPVVVLGSDDKDLPDGWKAILRSDTLIARHNELVGIQPFRATTSTRSTTRRSTYSGQFGESQ